MIEWRVREFKIIRKTFHFVEKSEKSEKVSNSNKKSP